MAKILVVEDDMLLSSIISRELASAGHELASVYKGEEALARAKEFTPDLVLLDLLMPQFDGFQVLDALKKDEELKSVPVIVLSNLGQKEDIEKAKAAGAADFLVKVNFAPKEIADKVGALLKSR